MDSLTLESAPNAFGQLFLTNTLSSRTNFLPEEVNLEGQLEIAILEVS